VAVSGGSDSLALMHLLGEWAISQGLPLPEVAIVDHALRSESAIEARRVQRWAKAAGLRASILTRKGPCPRGDLEAFAREARYRLIGLWARKRRIKTVFAAHTMDDQAETFLLRLARGSGVDGLAAMQPTSPWPLCGFPELVLARPLLTFEREGLRDELRRRALTWVDDPMNEDPRFARVRIRKAWSDLERLGLSKLRIAEAAAHLSRARTALEIGADELSGRALIPSGTDILLNSKVLCAAPQELALRVLAAALMTVSRQNYRPRFARLVRLYRAIHEERLGAGRTLHGCKIAPVSRSKMKSAAGMLLIRLEPGRNKPKENKE
jgi:tRNA(Ile)-lysidine synthase